MNKREIIYQNQNGKCALCGCSLHLDKSRGNDIYYMQLDHIMPKSLGGGNDMSNFRGLCRKCNSKRQDLSNKKLIKIILSEQNKSLLMNRKDLIYDDIKNNLLSKENIEEIEKTIIEIYESNISFIKELYKQIE